MRTQIGIVGQPEVHRIVFERHEQRIYNPLSVSKPRRTQENFFTVPLLCYNKTSTENESRHLGQNEMAGLKGKSGPPGNMNAFKYRLAS